MNNFNFWQKWLYYSCWLFAGVGLLVSVFNNAFMFDLWNHYFAQHFGKNGVISPEAQNIKTFLLGPLGGTILGSYILMGFIAKYPFKEKEPWAWKAGVFSLLGWFLLDSCVSAYHGAYFNILLINCFTLVVQGLPLLMTYRYFFPKSKG